MIIIMMIIVIIMIMIIMIIIIMVFILLIIIIINIIIIIIIIIITIVTIGLLASRSEVMINRDSWGHLYLTVRGEIIIFVKDGLPRKHLPEPFPKDLVCGVSRSVEEQRHSMKATVLTNAFKDDMIQCSNVAETLWPYGALLYYYCLLLLR